MELHLSQESQLEHTPRGKLHPAGIASAPPDWPRTTSAGGPGRSRGIG